MNKLQKADLAYTVNPEYPLDPDQERGVDFLLAKFNAILAFQAGFGKTYCSLTAAQHCINYSSNVRVVIICPKSANSAFKKELNEKIRMPYSIYTVEETREDPEAKYRIYNHTSVHKHKGEIKALAETNALICIVDEGHALQSNTSNFSRTMLELRKSFSMVWLLTATPLLNKIEGLFNVVQYVKPGLLGTYYQFKEKYLVTRKRTVTRGGRKVKFDEIVEYKNLDHLSKVLEDVAIVKRKDYDLDFHYLKTSMTEEEASFYSTAAKGILDPAYDKDNEKDFGARLHDLQRVVDNSHVEMGENRSLSSKEKLLLKTCRDVVARGESVLIYTDYEATEDRLHRIISHFQPKLHYKNLYRITGRVEYKERVEVEKNLAGSSIVIITRAGCQSINLQAANNVAFYDIPFSIGWFIQVVGRVARMNTVHDKQSIYLLEVEDTIDTYKRMLIQDHAILIKGVFGSESTLPKDLQKIDRKYMNQLRRKFLWK